MNEKEFELQVFKAFRSWEEHYGITPEFIEQGVISIFEQLISGIEGALLRGDEEVYANCWTIDDTKYKTRSFKETIMRQWVLPIVEEKLKEFKIPYRVFERERSMNVAVKVSDLRCFCKLNERKTLKVME